MTTTDTAVIWFRYSPDRRNLRSQNQIFPPGPAAELAAFFYYQAEIVAAKEWWVQPKNGAENVSGPIYTEVSYHLLEFTRQGVNLISGSDQLVAGDCPFFTNSSGAMYFE